MTKTITLTYTSLVSLTLPDNPTTITSSGLLEAGLYAAPIGVDWGITNAGTVEGAGITVVGAGSVTNQVGGTISGTDGIFDSTGALTVVNAGSIGGSLYAVDFGASFANRLVIDPGGTFTGTVDGGNTIGAAYVSTLELAAGAADGTITSLGIQYVNFAQITIDAAASWTLTGVNSLIAGTTLTDAGTLTNAGSLSGAVTLDVGAALTNASGSTITVTSGAAVYGVTGGAATIVNAGTISSAYSGLSYGVSLIGGGTVTNLGGATISGYGGVSGGSGGVGLTVVNYGSIIADYNGADAGVGLHGGGSVTNGIGGTISGYYGIYGSSAVTVVNAGSIAGYAGYQDGAGVLLTGGSVTNLSGGAISGYDGVFGNGGATLSVVNSGSIAGYGANGAGVRLHGGGSVTNLGTGSISGEVGVYAGGGATVENAGTISGSDDAVTFASGDPNRLVIDPGAVFTGTVDGGNPIGGTYVSTLELAAGAADGTITSLGIQYVNFAQITIDAGASWTLNGPSYLNGATLTDAGTLTNAGYLYGAVMLDVGGVLTNASTGTITVTNGAAVYGSPSGEVTVVNAGLITTGSNPVGYGVSLVGGGTVTNEAGAVISGSGGVYGGGGGSVTVVNYGKILGYYDDAGVGLLQGGNVTNYAGATISGHNGVYGGPANAVTVVNSGSISGYEMHGTGVRLLAGGGVTNQIGGAISGYDGVYGSTADTVTVVNYGSISGYDQRGAGVRLLGGGGVTNQVGGTISGYYGVYGCDDGILTVVNSGSIAGDTATGDGVFLDAGGYVTNNAGGTISGYKGIFASAVDPLTLLNGGVITGDALGGDGVLLLGGGYVTNLSSGTISGEYGISASGNATVVNAGTISGGLYAVEFSYGYTNLLVDDPDAAFIGTVDGGNPPPTGAVSTLELAAGAKDGTITSLGTQFIGFGQITIDAAASWTLTGANYVSAYTIFTDAGTLTNTGSLDGAVTLDGGAVLTNAAGGTITAASGAAVYGLPGGGAATVINAGTISSAYPGGTYGVFLDGGGTVTNQVSATISGYGGVLGGSDGGLTVVNYGAIIGYGLDGDGVRVDYGGSVTNQIGGTIGGYDGIYSGVLAPLTVVNYGGIAGSGLGGSGVRLVGGGNVTNQIGGTISGYFGVYAESAAATVVNAGAIEGSLTYARGVGIYLYEGGSVTNQSGGTISGSTGVYGYDNATVTVVNDGVITGDAAYGAGVLLFGSGSVTNQGGGTISGGSGISGSSFDYEMTVVNSGSIIATGSHGAGVFIYVGGSITNLSGATITGYGGIVGTGFGALTVVNYGSIGGNLTLAHRVGTEGVGVYLGDGGIVTNGTSATISGFVGVEGAPTGGDAATVMNYGVIAGNTRAGAGVAVGGGGSVTNQSGGTIKGHYGVYASGDYNAVTVMNYGSIAGGAGQSAVGVFVYDTGLLTNWGGASISGYTGVLGLGDGLTVVNYGSIAGDMTHRHGAGVVVDDGSAYLTNCGGGTISGYDGVYSKYGTVTLVNAGDISGSNFAVQFAYGYTNLLVIDPGAVFVGAVSGGNTIGGSYVSTLELASGASGGILSGFGAQYTDFAQVTIDTGASWTLTGANYFAAGVTLTNDGTLTVSNTTVVDAGSVVNDGSIVMDPSTLTLADLTGTGEVSIGAGGTLVTQGTVSGGETIDFASQSGWLALTPAEFSGEIAGFFAGDTIDLTGITDATSASIISGNTLQIEDGGTPILLTLDPSVDYSGATFSVGTDSSPNHYNTVTTDLACFAEGTQLDTPGGPVAVEALRAGDFVLTLRGAPRKVRWIGWRRLDLRRHPDLAAAQPVRVLADAVAAGEPRADVRLSPSHALLLGGALIPVGRLVNGATIRREEACRSVTYYHVELDTHDVLLAEGLAAESYLDTGNRGMFENADAPLMLHPELARGNDQARREAGSCAPFVADALSIEPVWRALAERARVLGHVLAAAVTTADPALRVQVDGRLVDPVMVRGECHVFVLPGTAGTLRLVSRATAPDALWPWVGDCRSLGVSVRRLTVRHGDGVEVIPLDHPDLRDGWWALERDGGCPARWTNGCAALPLGLAVDGPVILEVEIATLDAYLLTEAVVQPALRMLRRA